MNIKQAKQQVKHAVQAYFAKDEFGAYKIPSVRQRPLLLMGAPGIGKTAIMEQIARECNIALVSYSITHHTRQSAIGLPFIAQKHYGGKEYAITEYTMSEIIAAVYEKMEQTGLTEGILFLDEINCVSETLAPAMLQFLQAKTFGSHKLPEGWLIVAAGNPPEYNKSVREFDVVTLDRVKKIDISPDFSVWKEYAWKQNIHGAILSYLEIKKNHFYAMETTIDGKRFVTARGWEDLSNMLTVYEELNIAADETLIIQYLQHAKIAKDFANYLELYHKYQTDYKIGDILAGKDVSIAIEKLQQAQFDERLSVLGLLLSRLTEDFTNAYVADLQTTKLHELLTELKERFANAKDCMTAFAMLLQNAYATFEQQCTANILDKHQKQATQYALQTLEQYFTQAKHIGDTNAQIIFEQIKTQFAQVVQRRQNAIDFAGNCLKHAFLFLENTFGVGQEIVIFLSELTSNYYSVSFISAYGSDEYHRYYKELLFEEKQHTLLQEIKAVQSDIDTLHTLLFS